MRLTYQEAIARVFEDEGGYSNDRGDAGGPTKYGITIYDARKYWKTNATASDVRNMPKSVAEDIYRSHYASPVGYNELPPGVDYAVLDYAINSGVSRALRVYRKVKTDDAIATINAIYDQREAFLKSLSNFNIFGRGWLTRTRRGRALALDLNRRYRNHIPAKHAMAASTIISGTAVYSYIQHHPIEIAMATVALAALVWTAIHYFTKGT